MFQYEIIGNLDSDVRLDEDHFEFLLNKFKEDPRLGRCRNYFQGGRRLQFGNQTVLKDRITFPASARCFAASASRKLGDMFANKAGGIDWIAVTTARMMGWKTRSYREKSFFHFGHLGTAERGDIGLIIFLRREGLLSRRPSDLGIISSHLSTDQASLPRGWTCAGLGLWMGACCAEFIGRFPRSSCVFTERNRWRKLSVILKSLLTFKLDR